MFNLFIPEREAKSNKANGTASSSSSSSSSARVPGNATTSTRRSSSKDPQTVPSSAPKPRRSAHWEPIIGSDEEEHFARESEAVQGNHDRADQAEQEENNVEDEMEKMFDSDSGDDQISVGEIMTQLAELENY